MLPYSTLPNTTHQLSPEEKNLPLTQCFNSEAVNFYFMSRSSGTFTLQGHFLPHTSIHPLTTHPQTPSSSHNLAEPVCVKIFLVNIELPEDYKVQIPAGVCFAPSEELYQISVLHHKAV
jgi:hypothetical protein